LITRIEIDGFKTFQDFKLELSPFQVIVGTNGAGKSNLFDALQLLGFLAEEESIQNAFQKLRGDAMELFTKRSDGKIVDKIRLAVEMLVDRHVEDGGAETDLDYTRMRYELEISRQTEEQKLERLYVSYESLETIPYVEDVWRKRHGNLSKWISNVVPRRKMVRLNKISSNGKVSFISTGKNTIYLHPDRYSRLTLSVESTDVMRARTMLSRGTSIERPHVFAARQEMRSWKVLQLNPEVLRVPSSIQAPTSLSS